MIKVVDIFSFFITPIEWPHAFIALEELRLKTTKPFSESNITLAISPITSRVKAQGAINDVGDIAKPEITMQ
ncbi:Uncharacterised protein [Vibrio cholerae]|nr:Uncharacterised protein [Vibrio cholerae]